MIAHRRKARVFGYATGDGGSPSVEQQIEAIRTRARHIKGTWSGCYVDHEVSTVDDQPEFSRLMTDLQPGDHLLVWDLDRIPGSRQDFIAILDHLVGQQIVVHVLHFGAASLDLDESMGPFFVEMVRESCCILECERYAESLGR